MSRPSGLGKLDRTRITTLLRGTQHTISVKEAATLLGLSREHAAKVLARWATKWILPVNLACLLIR